MMQQLELFEPQRFGTSCNLGEPEVKGRVRPRDNARIYSDLLRKRMTAFNQNLTDNYDKSITFIWHANKYTLL